MKILIFTVAAILLGVMTIQVEGRVTQGTSGTQLDINAVEKRNYNTRSGNNGIVTTRTNWFQKIAGSLMSAVFGITLFFFSFVVLMANEGVFVNRLKVIERVKTLIHNAEKSRDEEAHPDNTIFYNVGNVDNITLTDSLFKVSTSCLRLRREVEMYQYNENVDTVTEKDTIGGGETTTQTYSLTREWSSNRIDLSGNAPGTPETGNPDFPYENGVQIKSQEFTGDLYLNEQYLLSQSQVSRLSPWKTHKREYRKGPNSGYGTMDSGDASIGDVRIHWEIVESNTFTVLCGVSENRLRPFTVREIGAYKLPYLCHPFACCGVGAHLVNMLTSGSNCIDVIQAGSHSTDSVIEGLHGTAQSIVWILRVVGFFLFAVSSSMMLSPIPAILDIIGPLGTLAGYGTWLVSLSIASILTPLTIGFCWLTYRPLIAVCIIVPPVLCYYLLL
eukprot:TRINITY_DN927_c7_g1_i1.p1 TRINITY_DN927_c7_g1~~TRINITY_DN927_c7_g1_i1.p1  ORF type:complete len:444 (+),score=25.78 TRINITY_DN927_c7_g1_i1:46-1377(+)